MPESRVVTPSLPRLASLLLLGLLALPALATDTPRPTVAVLSFDYVGRDDEMKPLGKGLAQMLITDLSGLESVRLVERERLQEIIDELKLGRSDKFDQATVARIGKLVGAHYLVMGSYFDMMDHLRVDARVVQLETGLIRSTGATGRPDEFLMLEQKLARQLGDILGESKPPPKKPGKLTTKTALRYARALDAKDRKDLETAKKELTEVVKEQPDFVLASTDLARLMK